MSSATSPTAAARDASSPTAILTAPVPAALPRTPAPPASADTAGVATAVATAATARPGGLEGIVVADTLLSDVDGERGRLVVRGHDVEDLARRCDFEALCALLWTGELLPPGAAGHVALRTALGQARLRAWQRLPLLGDALAADDAMDALRAALAHLRFPATAEAATVRLDVTAAMAVFAAAWARRHRGEAPVQPDATLGHAADFLRMAAGDKASAAADDEAGARVGAVHTHTAGSLAAARATALDAYLVTAADHGMNASTFTARVVASTQSDAVSAVVAALGALKGPLHGGAPGPVLAMLDAIGEPANAAPWITRKLAAGERIMGMGHRVYRVRDPRAAVLEAAVERLQAAGVHSSRLALARAVEAVATASLREHRPERRMAANVEFYTAVMLDAVGLPQELFTATFAVARVAGWLAHYDEQRANGRLIRPSSRYVGRIPPSIA